MKHLALARLPSLRLLKLRGTGLNAAALRTLSAGSWPSLSGLYLQDNHIDTQGMRLLVQGAWPELHYLGLTHNMLDEGVYASLEVRCWRQQCAEMFVSEVKPRSYAQAKSIAMSRSTGTTWPNLATVTVSVNTTYTGMWHQIRCKCQLHSACPNAPCNYGWQSIQRSDCAHAVCSVIQLLADEKLGSGGSSLFGHAT